MKKKIFIITGESSGDKLASSIVRHFRRNKFCISAVGSQHLKNNKIKVIFDSAEISVMGFADVIKKIFFLLKKINFTIEYIKKYKPDIIFSIDSPDFSFRVENKIKKMFPKIKIVHLVAPSIWAWRENRVYFFRKFIDHLLLLFPFEKKIFDKYKVKNTFVGHPFFENKIKYRKFSIPKNKKIITLCPGSRLSEIKIFMPIFTQLIKLINNKFGENFIYHFPVLKEHESIIKYSLKNQNSVIINIEENKKNFFIKKSLFTIAKSGTISLDICNNKSPLITIYKTSWFNYFMIRPFIKVKFGNIVNIMANKEIIPELIQFDCNVKKIFNIGSTFIQNKNIRKNNVINYFKYIRKITKRNTSKNIAKIIERLC